MLLRAGRPLTAALAGCAAWADVRFEAEEQIPDASSARRFIHDCQKKQRRERVLRLPATPPFEPAHGRHDTQR